MFMDLLPTNYEIPAGSIQLTELRLDENASAISS